MRTPSKEFVVLDDVRLLHLPSMHVFVWPHNTDRLLPFGSIAVSTGDASGVVKTLRVRKTCGHDMILGDVDAMRDVRDKIEMPYALERHGITQVGRLQRYISRNVGRSVAFECTLDAWAVLPCGRVEYTVAVDYDASHEDALLSVIPQHSIVADASTD